MMMTFSKYFLIIIACLMVGNTWAQKAKVQNDPTHDMKAVHFGFSLGTNVQDYIIKSSQMAIDSNVLIGVQSVSPGLDIHAIANFRLAKYLDLRMLPGISFGGRTIYYKDQFGKPIYDESESISLMASFIEMPVLFKYKAKRLNNVSAFFVGGINPKYDLTAKQRYDQDQQIIVSPFDIYIEGGAGFDFYLEYFKFAVEIKYGLGLKNIYSATDPNGKRNDDYPLYTDLISSIRSQVVVLSFHFE